MLDTYTCYVVMGVWDHLLKVPLTADPDLLGPLSKGKDVAEGVMPSAHAYSPQQVRFRTNLLGGERQLRALTLQAAELERN